MEAKGGNLVNKKYIFIIVPLLIVLTIFIRINSNNNNIRTNAEQLPKVSINDSEVKLKRLFGKKAENLSELDKERINGKDITHLRGNGASFDIDERGEIIAYLNEEVNYKTKEVIAQDVAMQTVIDELGRVFNVTDLKDYKLTTNRKYNNGSNEEYQFIWEKLNKDEVIEERVTAFTTLAGEIIFIDVNKYNVALTNQTSSFSKKEATEKALAYINTQVTEEQKSKIKLVKVKKVVIDEQLVWGIEFTYPGSVPTIVMDRVILINAITGEIINQ